MPAHAKNQFFDPDHRTRLINDLRAHGHRLNDRQQLVLRLRAALEDGRHHSYAELAERFEVTANRVRQIEKAALAKLQKPATLRGFEDDTGTITENDLNPDHARVTGEVIPLFTPGAALTPAQARIVLLSRVTRTGDMLRQLVASWLATVDAEHTRAAYRRDVSQYFDYCIQRDLDPLAVRIQDFNLYREHLARHLKSDGHRYSISTRSRKIAAISSLYHHLVDVAAVDRNPVTRKARFNHKPDPPDKSLTVDETITLINDAASGHRTMGGDCAAIVIELLFTMGIRVSEICSLDIDQLTHVIHNGKTYHSLTFTGKGDKEHVRAIPDELYEDRLAPYLAQRPEPATPDAVSALLLDLNGKRLNRKRIYDLVRRAHHRGLIPHKVSPHWGRHTFNVRAEESKFTIEQRQRALGHSSVVTTQGYGRARNNVVHDPSHAVAVFHSSRVNPQTDSNPDHQQQGGTSDERPRRSA